MTFQFEVTIETQRVSGKFASRDEIVEAITEALESLDVDLYGLGVDGDSEYELLDVDVREVTSTRRSGKQRRKETP